MNVLEILSSQAGNLCGQVNNSKLIYRHTKIRTRCWRDELIDLFASIVQPSVTNGFHSLAGYYVIAFRYQRARDIEIGVSICCARAKIVIVIISGLRESLITSIIVFEGAQSTNKHLTIIIRYSIQLLLRGQNVEKTEN